MIYYPTSLSYLLRRVFSRFGSALPEAMKLAFFPAIGSGIFNHYYSVNLEDSSSKGFATSLVSGALRDVRGVWGSFIFFVGFLIVFRTNQAYNRFSEGLAALTAMKAQWVSSCGLISAFVKASSGHNIIKEQIVPGAAQDDIVCSDENNLKSAATGLGIKNTTRSSSDGSSFLQLYARLLSMLHAAALRELEASALKLGPSAQNQSELLYKWINELIIKEMTDSGCLNDVPEPLVDRVFEALGGGMAAYNEAYKVLSRVLVGSVTL